MFLNLTVLLGNNKRIRRLKWNQWKEWNYWKNKKSMYKSKNVW